MIDIKCFRYRNNIYFEYAKNIRTEVFVIGQDCPIDEEFDEYDKESTHYIVFYDNIPVATSRWRKTEEGVKLERFAVLDKFRGNGLGKLLIKKMLKDTENLKAKRYLYAQEHAVGLYEKFDFKVIGNSFEEVGITHYKMVRL